MKLLLSIITINYNNAEGLQKTIESVKRQKFTDYEHIIVDGGSTDGSAEVITDALQDKKYAKHVTWWCSEKDKGIYNGMNKGIMHANGEYIATLNSGDYYVDDALESFSNACDKKCDAVLYGAISTYLNGVFEGVACSAASKLNKQMIPHPATFVPHSVYDKYGLYDESFKSSADWELFLRLYKNGVKFKFIDKIITHFDLSGMSNSAGELIARENERVLKMYGEYHVTPKQKVVRFLRKIYELLP